MPVQLIAKTKTPGICAIKGCPNRASLVFEGDGYKLRACSLAHAQQAIDFMLTLPKQFGMDKKTVDRILTENGRLKG